MDTQDLYRVGAMLAVALVWLFLNLKAGANWLKFVSLWATIVCLGGATGVAVASVFGYL